MSVQVLVPPVLEPVSLVETKIFLQLDSSFEDTLVSDLITAANETVEQTTGKVLIARTLRQTFHSWPDKGIFELSVSPLIQINQVQYRDANNVVSVVSPGDYYVDVNRARVIVLSTFPSFSFTHPADALQIDYVAGYGNDAPSIPPSFRLAILLIVRDLYEHRGESVGPMPLRAQALLAPFVDVRL